MEPAPRTIDVFTVHLTIHSTGHDSDRGHWFYIALLDTRFYTPQPSDFTPGDPVRLTITKDRSHALPR
jgi:hypothetical protein